MAHQTFLDHMKQNSKGVPFTSFQHPFLIDDEIAYKWETYSRAKKVLRLDKWDDWREMTGQIISAVTDACHSSVSENLLEHRYGSKDSSEGALYRVSTPEEKAGLEAQLFDFFKGGSKTPDEFGQRFDNFAEYLRQNHLGCNWAFVAYLAFLLSPQLYFPVRPSRFDPLLKYYGIDQDISGYVSWERYSLLLEVADILKSKLALYNPTSALEIQSYMWVVSYLVKDGPVSDRPIDAVPDFEIELETRRRRAAEKERIGLLGEYLVYEQERRNLESAGRTDLANRVQFVAADASLGFDILSFTSAGQELHIEVKTTTRARNQDNGFWLPDSEKQRAEQDSYWTIYRVWNIDTDPTSENIGNIVQDSSADWDLATSTWRVNPRVG